jgi:hypothetical protein
MAFHRGFDGPDSDAAKMGPEPFGIAQIIN